MVYVSEMIDHQADVLGISRSTALIHRRELLAAKFLSQGARGKYAPQATVKDAAAALIALMICPWPSRSAQYVRDFGSLRLVRWTAESDLLLKAFTRDSVATFGDAIAKMLLLLGDKQFADDLASETKYQRYGNGDKFIHAPSYSILINDTAVSAEVEFGSLSMAFHNTDLTEQPVYKCNPNTPKKERDKESIYERYGSPILSTKTVTDFVIEHIAAYVNGTPPFSELLKAAVEAEAGPHV